MKLIMIALAANVLSAALAAQIVEGHVVNAATGANIPGVRVSLYPAGSSAVDDGYSATSNAEGRFRIESVQTGTYTARYRANGFLPVPKPGIVVPPFSVPGGTESVRLDVTMQPFGKLSGRVKDGAGNPVKDASIWFVNGSKWCKPPSCFHVHYQSKTDEKGEYTINDLDRGPAWCRQQRLCPGNNRKRRAASGSVGRRPSIPA